MTTTNGEQRRRAERKRTDPSVVRVLLKDREGKPRWATAYLSDVTEAGIGLSLMTKLEVGSMVLVRGSLGEGRSDVEIQADVKWCTERTGGVFQVGLELVSARSARPKSEKQEAISEEPGQLDCYALLQLDPKADADAIQRVHRILAQRYHPDTPGTGNSEKFTGINNAAGILTDPERRAQYDARYRASKQLPWKFDQAQVTLGPQAERAKRKGILGLLYAKALHDPERATMTDSEFEELLACPRERLQAALWYLTGKGCIVAATNSGYGITVAGFDEVESHSQLPAAGSASPEHQTPKLVSAP